jgi:hypothetical protein
MIKIVLIPLYFLLLSASTYAENIKFSGSGNIYTEYNTSHGVPQKYPESVLRFNLMPTLYIYKMPISLELFLSTEESNLRQPSNKFRIHIQPEELTRDMVHLPAFIFSISNVEIGTFYPRYSIYTLSGIPVTGWAAELNPSFLYTNLAVGRIQRAVQGSDTTYPAYERKLFAGKFGIGKKDKTHLFFTYLHAGDDSTSISSFASPVVSDSDSIEAITPQENYLIGLEFMLNLLDDRFILKSEIIGSQLTRDIRMPELTIPNTPSLHKGIFHPRMSSIFDYAYSVKPTYIAFDTKIWGRLKMVGPGYVSLGTPNLRNDNFVYELGINKTLLNNNISLSASQTKEHDNLIGNKISTTSFTSYSFNISLSFPNLPHLQIGYAPYYQTSDTLSFDSKNEILFLSTGHSYTLFDLNTSTDFSYSLQTYREESEVNNYSSNNYSIYESIAFNFPLSISTGIGINTTDYSNKKSQIFSFDIRASYTSFQIWTNSLGFAISSEGKENARYGINLFSTLPTKFLNVNFRVLNNIYREEEIDENYDEWRFISTLSRNW